MSIGSGFLNAFAFAYPNLAKQLGLVTSEQKKQKQALAELDKLINKLVAKNGITKY